MSPQQAYDYLNQHLWAGRLPEAKVDLVENELMPKCWGLTIAVPGLARPVILLNINNRKWEVTLVHEMLHIAEPMLPEGKLFESLVRFYWEKAKGMTDKVFS